MTISNQASNGRGASDGSVECISAVTLGVGDMQRSVRFYGALGFAVRRGGENASFTSLNAGSSSLNLTLHSGERPLAWWGRVIFYVTDVDACYRQALAAGLKPEAPPRDAAWDERYFHIADPDGHELSFARPLD